MAATATPASAVVRRRRSVLLDIGDLLWAVGGRHPGEAGFDSHAVEPMTKMPVSVTRVNNMGELVLVPGFTTAAGRGPHGPHAPRSGRLTGRLTGAGRGELREPTAADRREFAVALSWC
jgi:hypothetical protein